MRIIVTGTPGTGKTQIAKAIAKQLHLTYIDVNEIINQHDLKEEFDKKRETFVVDEKKLSNILNKLAAEKDNLVIDSHLSHYMDPTRIDLCIVTKCNPKELRKRLKKRNYSLEKIKENVDAELFDVCLNEAFENGFNLLIVDTTNKTAAQVVKNLLR